MYTAPIETVTTDAIAKDANAIVRYLAVSRAIKLHTAVTTCTSSSLLTFFNFKSVTKILASLRV